MRGTQGAGIAALLLLGGPVDASAQDDTRSCADVHVQIRGWPESGSAAKIVEAVFAEVASRRPRPCDDGAAHPVASIDVDWHVDHTALLRVDVAQGEVHYVAGRVLDLTRVSNDALALAIAIAADELLREAADQAAASQQPNARMESPAAPVEPSPRPVEPHSRARTWSFGSSIGAEWFSSSALLVGPDAVLERPLRRRLALSMHLGLRAPFVPGEAARTAAVATSGAWLRWQAIGDADEGAGLSAGLDFLTRATAGGDMQATVIPGLGIIGWRSLPQCCRLVAELGGGRPIIPLRVSTGAEVDGVELRSNVSLMIDF